MNQASTTWKQIAMCPTLNIKLRDFQGACELCKKRTVRHFLGRHRTPFGIFNERSSNFCPYQICECALTGRSNILSGSTHEAGVCVTTGAPKIMWMGSYLASSRKSKTCFDLLNQMVWLHAYEDQMSWSSLHYNEYPALEVKLLLQYFKVWNTVWNLQRELVIFVTVKFLHATLLFRCWMLSGLSNWRPWRCSDS